MPSQYWFACFRDANGRQRRKSTKTPDQKKAIQIAEQYEQKDTVSGLGITKEVGGIWSDPAQRVETMIPTATLPRIALE
jgi:hypothetical protein